MLSSSLLRKRGGSHLAAKSHHPHGVSDAMVIAMRQQDIKTISKELDTDKQIRFQNKLFIKGPSFSKKAKGAAIKFCRQCLAFEISCLFVENDSYFTIWLQQNNAYAV